MGKDKTQPRTKGNQRPSSSKSAANFLEQNVGGLSLSGTSGAEINRLTGYVPIDQDPAAAQIHPEIRVQLRLLEKKDAVTKHKALQKLLELVPTLENDSLFGALPYWPRIYCRLCKDEDKKVRDLAQKAHGYLSTRCGKHMKPYLKQILPYWIMSQNDLCDSVAFSATHAFHTTFPSQEKQTAAYQYAWQEIIQLVRDRLHTSPLPTSGEGSKKRSLNATNEESEEDSYIRYVCASLRSIAYCVSPFTASGPHLSSHVKEGLCELLHDKIFWRHGAALTKLRNQKQPVDNPEWACVHAAYCQVISQICLHLPDLVREGSYCAVQMCDLTLRHVCDTSPVLVSELWPSILNLLCVEGFDSWRFVSFRKVFLPELCLLLEQGIGQGVGRQVAPNLLPLLSHLPLSPWTLNESGEVGEDWSILCELFDKFRNGLSREKAEMSFIGGDVCALVAAYLECGRYFLMQFIKNDQMVRALQWLDTVILNVWREAFLKEGITRNYYNTVNEHLADLILSLTKNVEGETHLDYSQICERIVSRFYALLEADEFLPQVDVKIMHFLKLILSEGRSSQTTEGKTDSIPFQGAHSKRVNVTFSAAGPNLEAQREKEAPSVLIIWNEWKWDFFLTLRQRLQNIVDRTKGQCLLSYLLTCYALSQKPLSFSETCADNTNDKEKEVTSLPNIVLLSVSLIDYSLFSSEEVAGIVSCALAEMLQRMSIENAVVTFEKLFAALLLEDRILVFLDRILSKFVTILSFTHTRHLECLVEVIHNHMMQYLTKLWQKVFVCDSHSEDCLSKVEKLMACIFSPFFTYFPHFHNLRQELGIFLDGHILKIIDHFTQDDFQPNNDSLLYEEGNLTLLMDAGIHIDECLEQLASTPLGQQSRLNCITLLAQLFTHHAMLWGWKMQSSSHQDACEGDGEPLKHELYYSLPSSHICNEVKTRLVAYCNSCGSSVEEITHTPSSDIAPLPGSLEAIWNVIVVTTGKCSSSTSVKHLILICHHIMKKATTSKIRQIEGDVVLDCCLRSVLRPIALQVARGMSYMNSLDFHSFLSPALILHGVNIMLILKMILEEFGHHVLCHPSLSSDNLSELPPFEGSLSWIMFILFSSVLENYDLSQLPWGGELCEDIFHHTFSKFIRVNKYAAAMNLQQICYFIEDNDPLGILKLDSSTDVMPLYRHMWLFCLPRKQIEWHAEWIDTVNAIPALWRTVSNKEFSDFIEVYLPAGSSIRICLLDSLSHSIADLMSEDNLDLNTIHKIVRLIGHAMKIDRMKYFPLLPHILSLKEQYAESVLIHNPQDLENLEKLSLTCGIFYCFVRCLDDFHLFSEEMADFLLCYTTSISSTLFSGDVKPTFWHWEKMEWFVLAHLILQVVRRLQECVDKRAKYLNDDHFCREVREFFSQEIMSTLLDWWHKILQDDKTSVATIKRENCIILGDLCAVIRQCPVNPPMLLQHVTQIGWKCEANDPCLNVLSPELLGVWNYLMPLVNHSHPFICVSAATGLELILPESAELLDKRMKQHTEEDIVFELPLALTKALKKFPEEIYRTALSLGRAEFWKKVLTPLAISPSVSDKQLKNDLEKNFPNLLGYLLSQSICLHLLSLLSTSSRGKLLFTLSESVRRHLLRFLDLLHSLLPKSGEVAYSPKLHRDTYCGEVLRESATKTNLWLAFVNALSMDGKQTDVSANVLFLRQPGLTNILKLLGDSSGRTTAIRWLHLRSLILQICMETYTILPLLVRRWWINLPKKSSESVSRYVDQNFSSFLVERELTQIQSQASETLKSPAMSDVKVKINVALREVMFELQLADSHLLKLEIRYPSAYPLASLVAEETGRFNFTEPQWRGWMMQITQQNVNLWTSILLFRENFRRKLEGAEECAICYSVLQWNDSTLPKMKCRTCRKRFHHACLFQWFRSTPLPTCPLCREVFR